MIRTPRVRNEMSSRRRQQTRLTLDRLEDRLQPSTLLTADIEFAVLGDVLFQPHSDSGRVIKRLKSFDDAPIVSPAPAASDQVTAPATGERTITAATPSLPVMQTVVNSVARKPRMMEQLSVGGSEMRRVAVEKAAAPKPTIAQVDLGARSVPGPNGPSGHSPVSETPGGDAGGRAADWSSYDANGTNRADGANGVAIGTAGCFDHTITVGFQGRSGTVRTYAPGGALVASQSMPPPAGLRTRLNGIGIHPATGEIYAVGTTRTSAGALVDNFIAKWTCKGGALPTAVASYPPNFPGGTTMELRDVDVELGVGSDLEVTAVGTADIGVGHDVIQISHWDESLAGFHIDVTANFGVPTKGLSVAIDDGFGGHPFGKGTRYIGGNIDSGVDVTPLNFDLDDFDAAGTYAWNWFLIGGVSGTRPTSGLYGMDQVGTQLYMSGSLTDTFFHPAIPPDPDPYDHLLILNVDAATSTIQTYGWAYSVGAGDLNSRGSDVLVVTGELFTNGSVDVAVGPNDPQSLTFGALAQFDVLGDYVAVRETGDCDGVLNKDSDGTEVAVQYAFNGDFNVSVSGITNAGKASFEGGACPAGNPPQFLNGADADYGAVGGPDLGGPPSDGYVFRDNDPVGT
jgi:hypothetical protein